MTSGTSGDTTALTGDTTALTGERADLLTALAKARHFLRFTTRDLDDEQARRVAVLRYPQIASLQIFNQPVDY